MKRCTRLCLASWGMAQCLRRVELRRSSCDRFCKSVRQVFDLPLLLLDLLLLFFEPLDQESCQLVVGDGFVPTGTIGYGLRHYWFDFLRNDPNVVLLAAH